MLVEAILGLLSCNAIADLTMVLHAPKLQFVYAVEQLAQNTRQEWTRIKMFVDAGRCS